MSTIQATTERLNGAYLARHGRPEDGDRREFWRNARNDPTLAAQIECYWGVALPDVSIRSIRKLTKMGVIGSYIWPTYEAVQHLTGRSLSAATFAERAEPYLPKSALGGAARKKRLSVLADLLRLRPRAYPPVKDGADLVNAVLAAAAELDPRLSSDLVRGIVNNGRYLMPGGVFEALVREVGQLATGASPLLSYIHPNLPITNESTNPRHSQMLLDIERALKGHRVQVITGPDFGGKSTVVREYLRYLRGSKRDTRAIRHEGLQLPIFAMSGRDMPYSQLIYEVYRFLVLRPGCQRKPRTLDLALSHTPEDMLRAISEAADVPALYIVTDLNVFEPGEILRSVNGRGIRRLVEILAKESGNTRIILTSSRAPTDSGLDLSEHLRNAKIHLIKPPTLENLGAFIPAYLVDQTFQMLRKARAELGEDGEDILQCEVAGHLLQATASAINIIGRVDEELLYRLQVSAALSARSRPRTSIDTAPLFKHIWRLLKDKLEPSVFRALCLLSSSDDGYAVESLSRALEMWPPSDGNCPDMYTADVFARLTEISKATHERLLMLSSTTRIGYDEADPTERNQIDTGRTISSYNLDPPMQRHLSDALRITDPRTYQIAHRITACIARGRALNIKVNQRRIYGAETKDIRRDIQTLSCLLASLEVSGPWEPAYDSGISTTYESDVFAVEPRATQSQIVRYAYMFVMRREIDWDDRLTMVLDEDRLRLDLLLGLVDGVGRRFWGANAFEPKSIDLPPHLTSALHSVELGRLIRAIGVSGHFCNRLDICTWALRVLEKLAAESQEEVLRGAVAHLKCLSLDNLLLQGGTGDRVGDLETARREVLRPALVAVGHMSDPILKAKMTQRLQRRLLQISLVVDPIEPRSVIKANDILTAILETQDIIVNLTGDYTESLTGRTSVTLMRLLFGDPVFQRPMWAQLGWTKDRTLRLFHNLLAVSAGRLSRYSGAERANVAICKAYFSMINEEFKSALHYSQLAHDRIELPKVSPSFQAHITWAQAQISFLAAGDCDDRQKLINDSFASAEHLGVIADSMGFIDFKAKAIMLMAKLMLSPETGPLMRSRTPGRLSEARGSLETLIATKDRFGLHYVESIARELLALEGR